MSKLRWIIFAVICALLLGGLVFISGRDKKDVSNIEPSQIVTGQNGTIGDHVYGNEKAKVVLFEYGDFQCPSCAGAYTKLTAIKELYKEQIAFVYRHFPLTTIHPNALASATASVAASKQGKFWEMHDQLYENQNSWSSASTSTRGGIFEQYAAAIGLNMEQYQKDLTSKEVADKIASDRALAKKLGLESTPSLLIGDQKMSADVISDLVGGDGTKLKQELDKALKAAGVEPPKAE